MVNKRLLILEDDIALANAMAEMFENAGYTVFVANNIAAAKKYYDVDIALIDLILFDDMSGCNGLTFARWLKEKNPTCWRTIMTAHPDFLNKVMPNDAHHKIEKPIPMSDLLGVVNGYNIEGMQVENDRLDYVVLRGEVLSIKNRVVNIEHMAEKLTTTIELMLPISQASQKFMVDHKGNELKLILWCIGTLITILTIFKFIG